MALQVSLFTEPELPQFTTLAIESFHRGLGHFLIGPNTPANIDYHENKNLKAFRGDPKLRFVKVVSSETDRIIAAAKWVLFPNGNTEEELDEMFTLPVDDPTYKKEFTPIYERLNEVGREIMGGRPYFFLTLLFTHPDAGRRGAGGLLTRWGTERADEIGCECYVESSLEGRSLYERYGFREVK
jgi:hypothetical protein